MKNLVAGLTALILLLSCGEKKPTAAELAEAEREYNYRSAMQQYKLGANALNNKDTLKAIEHLEQAVEKDDQNFTYHHWLALAYSMNGQLAEAEEHLKKALAINPNNAESHNLMGSILVDQGRFDEAVVSFRKVIQDKNYPEPKFPYFNLGKCLVKQQRPDQAVAAFEFALRFDPKFYRAYIALGEIFKDKKDYMKMLYYYQKAEPAYANDVNVLFNIGLAHFQLKQFNRAKRYLAQVSILFPPPAIDQPTQKMLQYINRME
ncbi:MAG: tetratricopeptide repeat protein [Acidobacteriota bacterium]|nr:tetratricopeptide repeat protein [Acidobacteriota bacterium]